MKKTPVDHNAKAARTKTERKPKLDVRPLLPSADKPLKQSADMFENIGMVLSYTGPAEDIRAFEARLLSQMDEDTMEMFYDFNTYDDGSIKETTVISLTESIHSGIFVGHFQTSPYIVASNVQFKLTVYDRQKQEPQQQSAIEITAFAEEEFLTNKLYKVSFENYMRNHFHLEPNQKTAKYQTITFD